MSEEKHEEVTDVLEPELEALLHADPMTGLTDKEVNDRLEQFGKNGMYLYSALCIFLNL